MKTLTLKEPVRIAGKDTTSVEVRPFSAGEFVQASKLDEIESVRLLAHKTTGIALEELDAMPFGDYSALCAVVNSYYDDANKRVDEVKKQLGA